MTKRHYWTRTERSILVRRALGHMKVNNVPTWKLRALLREKWKLRTRWKR